MSLIADQVARTRFRAEPDLYRVREGQGAVGNAERIEDEDGLPRRSLRRRDDDYEDDASGSKPHP
jgi:hypothetical protein